jgi:hypothetical protein
MFHPSRAWPQQAGSSCAPIIDAAATITRALAHFFAFFILTTPPLRIVTVERSFGPACGARPACHGKTSIGGAGRDS